MRLFDNLSQSELDRLLLRMVLRNAARAVNNRKQRSWETKTPAPILPLTWNLWSTCWSRWMRTCFSSRLIVDKRNGPFLPFVRQLPALQKSQATGIPPDSTFPMRWSPVPKTQTLLGWRWLTILFHRPSKTPRPV